MVKKNHNKLRHRKLSKDWCNIFWKEYCIRLKTSINRLKIEHIIERIK